MFLYKYQDWTYYIEEMDTVVVLEESGQTVRIHDIIAEKTPRFTYLGNFLMHFQPKEI